jgi:hypothetical protein
MSHYADAFAPFRGRILLAAAFKSLALSRGFSAGLSTVSTCRKERRVGIVVRIKDFSKIINHLQDDPLEAHRIKT